MSDVLVVSHLEMTFVPSDNTQMVAKFGFQLFEMLWIPNLVLKYIQRSKIHSIAIQIESGITSITERTFPT